MHDSEIFVNDTRVHVTCTSSIDSITNLLLGRNFTYTIETFVSTPILALTLVLVLVDTPNPNHHIPIMQHLVVDVVQQK